MTKRLEALLDEVRALSDERQDEIADVIALQLGRVPDWHREILRERLADEERNPDDFIMLEELEREVRDGWRQ